MLRPNTSNPLSPYCLCIACKCGISSRHGPHQIPHRFKMTTLPLCSESLVFVPSSRWISPSAIPLATGGKSEGLDDEPSEADLPAEVFAALSLTDGLQAVIRLNKTQKTRKRDRFLKTVFINSNTQDIRFALAQLYRNGKDTQKK